MEHTITFDEEVKGWTSFFSFVPEFMTGLNGKFFSFSNGEVFQHNSKNVPRNNFYGEQFTSKVGVLVNENPSTEKVFKTLMLEGNKTWKALLKTNLSEGSIYRPEYDKKQSRFFAYMRGNEGVSDVNSLSTNGIGRVTDIVGSTLFFNNISEMITVGDKLTQMQSEIPVEIGIIDFIDRETGEINIQTLENAPALNEYCYSTKNSRIDGGDIRGYYLRVDLENEDLDFTELFAITSNTSETDV